MVELPGAKLPVADIRKVKDALKYVGADIKLITDNGGNVKTLKANFVQHLAQLFEFIRVFERNKSNDLNVLIGTLHQRFSDLDPASEYLRRALIPNRRVQEVFNVMLDKNQFYRFPSIFLIQRSYVNAIRAVVNKFLEGKPYPDTPKALENLFIRLRSWYDAEELSIREI